MFVLFLKLEINYPGLTTFEWNRRLDLRKWTQKSLTHRRKFSVYTDYLLNYVYSFARNLSFVWKIDGVPVYWQWKMMSDMKTLFCKLKGGETIMSPHESSLTLVLTLRPPRLWAQYFCRLFKVPFTGSCSKAKFVIRVWHWWSKGKIFIPKQPVRPIFASRMVASLTTNDADKHVIKTANECLIFI